MVVVTHEMGFARSRTSVVFLDGGRILEVASPHDFFAVPKSDRARDFISKILSH
jgi:glutamate transport system ATP-binding protein